MSLRQRISDELKTAMKARDEARASALRMLRAAILNKDKAGQGEADEAAILQIVAGLIKQRHESATAFRQGGREEMAFKEEGEARILESFLPAQLPEGEVLAAVERAIADAGATSIKEMGKVMAILKGELTGRADLGKVSALVKGRLG